MLTLFHAPRTRSTRVVALLAAMKRLGEVDVRLVYIPRVDGSGGPDAGNPHPEGKVPLLVHDGVAVRESAAIMLYLTDLFAGTDGLGVPVGDPLRGRYLAWLAWYAGVLEPVMVLDAAGLSFRPRLGGELVYRDALAFRAGIADFTYNEDYGTQITPAVGAGLHLGALAVDYSFGDFSGLSSELGYSHRVSVGYRFGGGRFARVPSP